MQSAAPCRAVGVRGESLPQPDFLSSPPPPALRKVPTICDAAVLPREHERSCGARASPFAPVFQKEANCPLPPEKRRSALSPRKRGEVSPLPRKEANCPVSPYAHGCSRVRTCPRVRACPRAPTSASALAPPRRQRSAACARTRTSVRTTKCDVRACLLRLLCRPGRRPRDEGASCGVSARGKKTGVRTLSFSFSPSRRAFRASCIAQWTGRSFAAAGCK